MWLTTTGAVDGYRRNSPGRGRPISAATAWARLRAIADEGDLAELQAARVPLRARATHRTFALPEIALRRIAKPKGAFRSGRDALDIVDAGDPVDLYATTETAERLVDRTGATASPDGLLHLHVLPSGMHWPRLSRREELVLAWCDLADRADGAADFAADLLWPGSIGVQRLADVVRGETSVPFVELRGFTDWLERHPELADKAIADPPALTGDPSLDSLFAAIAETVADDHRISRPKWTRSGREVRGGGVGGGIPEAFERRGIDFPRETFWHVR